MSLTVAALAAEEAGHVLPMPPISYGLIALVIFAALLGVTWTFRNTHQKYAPPSEHGAGSHGGHGADGAVERHH